MRNLILVFLSSIDHKFDLSNLYRKIGIYRLMLPHVFEYYCVFCRRFCNCWWEDYWRSDEE